MNSYSYQQYNRMELTGSLKKSYLKRMDRELNDLSQKVYALSELLEANPDKHIMGMDKFLLEQQLYFMKGYQKILVNRLNPSS